LENAFAVAGIAASVGLASIDLAYPLLAAGGVYICLGLVLTVTMPETAFRRTRVRGRGLHRSLAATMRAGVGIVRGKRVLLIVLAVAVVHGLSTEGFDRLVTSI
jgi:DHA3 family tetracycline resistance protein-like MFS transporter